MLQKDQINRLTRLKELLDAGVLSEEEFAKEKAIVMQGDANDSPSVQEKADGTVYTEESDGGWRRYVLLAVHAVLLVMTVVLFFVSLGGLANNDDPAGLVFVSLITAIITITLSWIKDARIPKAYAIVSTCIAGSVIIFTMSFFASFFALGIAYDEISNEIKNLF
ncbi:MAG: SHOCT domain-containing protein [Bacteroidales bacterium]|nr:SHOCT domain-containing protein [Bacteroidales bacterium]